MQHRCVVCSKPLRYDAHDTPKRRCRECAREHMRRLYKPLLPMAPGSSMLVGPGERRDDCKHYRACLLDFCNRSAKDGHCADGCRFYESEKQEREWRKGVDWSGYPSGGGW